MQESLTEKVARFDKEIKELKLEVSTLKNKGTQKIDESYLIGLIEKTCDQTHINKQYRNQNG